MPHSAAAVPNTHLRAFRPTLTVAPAALDRHAVLMRDVADTLAWIENNRTVATNEDTGTDLDSAKALQRNFEEFKATLEVNRQSRVTRVTDEALRLVSAGNPQRDEISEKERAIAAAWMELKELVLKRDEALDSAMLVHEYNRNVDEAVARVLEKAAPLSSDVGEATDLAEVEALRRAHEALVIQVCRTRNECCL